MAYFSPPSYYGRPPQQGDHISDLLMEQGRIAAEGAAHSSQIWGNAIGNVGQIASAGIQQWQEKKALKKRDTAWAGFVNDREWMKDPQIALAGANKIWGPQDGPEKAKGLIAFRDLSEKGDRADLERLPMILKSTEDAPDETMVDWYPKMLAKAAPVLERQLGMPIGSLPAQWDPKLRPRLIALRKALSGEKPEEVKTREIKRRNADGSETIEIVADKPGYTATSAAEPAKPDARSIEIQMADAASKGDQAAYTRLLKAKRDAEMAGRAPTAPKAPHLERIETVDADGKPVTQFVEPKAGSSYAKPTGAGKPATGQQRKALGFFNRAKEAQEIASSLEEGNTISPTSVKYIPDVLNFMQSNPDQAYIQAQRAFTEARLRKDSGAAVPQHEYETDALTYFAQPGDSDATKAQKRAGRNAILASIGFESGDALKEFYGDEADTMIADYKKHSRAGGPVAPPPPGGGAPAKGSRRLINGKMGEWDGSAWRAVK